MTAEINYETQSNDATTAKVKNDQYLVSNEEVLAGAVELTLLLYARLMSPKNAKSIPVVTKVPQILSSISEEKKLAIGSLSQTRSQVFAELGERMREMSFTYFDKYNLTSREKKAAWLLLTAHSTKEITEELHISEPSFRYAVRQMCAKTKTTGKDELVTKLREGLKKM